MTDEYTKLVTEGLMEVLKFSNWQLGQMDALLAEVVALRAVADAALIVVCFWEDGQLAGCEFEALRTALAAAGIEPRGGRKAMEDNLSEMGVQERGAYKKAIRLEKLKAVAKAARPLTHNYYMLLDGEIHVPYPHQLQELCDAIKELDKEQ